MAIKDGLKDDTTLDFGEQEPVGNSSGVSADFDKFVNDTAGDIADGQADVTDESKTTDTEAGSKTEDATKSGSSDGTDAGKQPANKEQEKAQTVGANDLKLEDGTVVKAGAERRFYDQLQVSRQETAALRNTINQHVQDKERLRGDLAATREAIQTTHGVEPQDLGAAVTLYKQLRLDPTGTLRLLLTEAQAAGYSIGEAAKPAVDTDAIYRQLEQRFAPLLAPLQQQQGQQQQEQDVTAEVNSFYINYPDARIHDSTIAAVIESNPRVSLQEAYFQLKGAFAQRGLDWSKPLDVQARPANSEQQQQQQAPMNGGRQVPANGITPASRVPIASETASTGDIVRDAMREAGL